MVPLSSDNVTYIHLLLLTGIVAAYLRASSWGCKEWNRQTYKWCQIKGGWGEGRGGMSSLIIKSRWKRMYTMYYTPMAVVIDSHLPWVPLFSSYIPDWPLPHHIGNWDDAPDSVDVVWRSIHLQKFVTLCTESFAWKCTHFTEICRKFYPKMKPSLWNAQRI